MSRISGEVEESGRLIFLSPPIFWTDAALILEALNVVARMIRSTNEGVREALSDS